jgi:hypothetical protein
MRNLELGSKRVRGKKNLRNIKKFVIRKATTAVHTNLRLDLRTLGCAVPEDSEAAFGDSTGGLWFLLADAAGKVELAAGWLPALTDLEGSMTLEGPLSLNSNPVNALPPGILFMPRFACQVREEFCERLGAAEKHMFSGGRR